MTLPGVIGAEVTNASHFVADSFRVTLSSTAQPITSNAAYWSTGAYDQIGVSIGFENEAALQLITGQVDDIDYDLTNRTIILSGRDLSAALFDSRTSEKFQNLTASQIAQTLALRHGLDSEVQQTATQAGTYYNIDHTVLTQEQTEWDLLVFLAEQEGFDVWVSGTKLYFLPTLQAPAIVPPGSLPWLNQPSPPAGQTPPLPWQVPATKSQPGQNLDTYVIKWNQPPTGSPDSNATSIQLHRSETLAKDIEVHVLSFNQKGQESVFGVAKAFGAKSVRKGKAQLYTFRRPNLTRDQAQKLAQSYLADLTRHEMTLSASLPGDNVLSTRTLVQLVGTGTAWDQLYYPDSVTRRISFSEGYRMEVRAKNHSTQSTV